MTESYDTIDRNELEQLLAREAPNNDDPETGYALVNVLGKEAFEKEHIPGSINIPQGEEEHFEHRFDKDKKIVVYCASPECDASPKAARALVERGFTEVVDYEGGMSDWKQGGGEIVGEAA